MAAGIEALLAEPLKPSGRLTPCSVRNCSQGSIALSYSFKHKSSTRLILNPLPINVPNKHTAEFFRASMASTMAFLPSRFPSGEKAGPLKRLSQFLPICSNALHSRKIRISFWVFFFFTSCPFRRGLHESASARPAKDSGFSPLGISRRLDVTKLLMLYGTVSFVNVQFMAMTD